MEKRYSGISEYTFNLLNSLFKIDSLNEYFLFYNSGRPVKIPEFNFSNVKIKGFKYPNKVFNLALRFLKIPQIDKMISEVDPVINQRSSNGVDLFFMPNLQFYALSSKVKEVITMHDLSFEHYPNFFSAKGRLWHKLVKPKKIVTEFDKVIAVSENTKRDLIELYGIEGSKVEVIYPGVGNEFKPITDSQRLSVVKQKYNLPDNFILYLGTLEPRKNIQSLIEAFELVNSQESIVHNLVIAGQEGWLYEDIYRKAQKSKAADKIKFIGYVDHTDKPALYSLAQVFVYPSFYEGFGFPPLEAMACGAPVIASYSSSLPEIVGEGGLMIDPYNINELAIILKQVLTNNNLRDGLKNKGLKQAQRFSWQNCAQKTLQLLESV